MTAFFDVVDGECRRGDGAVDGLLAPSTIRARSCADGALMAGRTVFYYATNARITTLHGRRVCLLWVIATFVVSYTRAPSGVALGNRCPRYGVMQLPERIVLLSAPQALFGCFWNGWVPDRDSILLTVTASSPACSGSPSCTALRSTRTQSRSAWSAIRPLRRNRRELRPPAARNPKHIRRRNWADRPLVTPLNR